jgi:hypothetical protein
VLQAIGFVKGERNRWPELQELAMGNDELLSSPGAWPNFIEGDDLSGNHTNAFFVQGSDGRFHDIAAKIGLGDTSVTRGIALADVDGDGDLDFAIARQWQPSALFINLGGQDRKSLLLDLLLTNPDGTTRPAIGAVATATLGDGHSLSVFSDSSNGHSGHRSPEVHFGLGQDITKAVVTVTWRSAGERHTRQYVFAPGRHRVVLDKGIGIDLAPADTGSTP